MYYYKIVIEYDGSGFGGWQRQNHIISVQQVIEEAIFSFSNEHVIINVAGRTDAGVHALAQVASFCLRNFFLPNTVTNAINFYLKNYKVTIKETCLVGEDFHARFSARARHYVYKIINRSAKPVIDLNRVWWVREKLDANLMQEGANFLLGKHDFSSFRAKDCQAKSPVKTISSIIVSVNEEEIKIFISAPSFLYHMVRNITGTLRLVGNKKICPKDIKNILLKKDRKFAGPTAPAHGLYLTKIEY